MKYTLHPACAAWPPMSGAELCDLAADIAANTLRDAITVTPANELLDGRNRVLAAELAGVEIPADKIETYAGDPWLFSLSKNKHRRHMSVDAIAMVAATLATRPVGANQFGEGRSNEPPSIAEAAKAAGIPETAVKSAKAVLKDGTPQEVVEASQRGKLRKVADRILARTTAPRKTKPAPVDPIQAIAANIERDFADGQWRTADKSARLVGCAESAFREALALLGDAVEENTGSAARTTPPAPVRSSRSTRRRSPLLRRFSRSNAPVSKNGSPKRTTCSNARKARSRTSASSCS
jgi:ParB-like chromosome segregation protein Spo0J